MSKLIAQCPSCQGPVSAIKLACDHCHTRFEGHFPISPFLRLTPEDQEFILEFVRVSGSLKEMAKRLDVSYPTVRNRLDQLIETLETVLQAQSSPEEILQALEKGTITAAEALKRLRGP